MDTINTTKKDKVDRESLKQSIKAKRKAMEGKEIIYKGNHA